MVRGCALVAVLLGCSTTSAKITWHEFQGAPEQVASIAFDTEGNPVVFGHGFTDNTAYVQHVSGGSWVQSDVIPGTMAAYGALARQPGGPMFALVDQALYRLDDETAFQWTAVPMPATPTPYVLDGFSIDTAGTFYWSDGGGLYHWSVGESAWALFPGTNQLSDLKVVIGKDGTIFGTANGIGILAINTTGTQVVLDCNQPQYLNCDAAIGGFDGVGLDDAGDLYFRMCAQNFPPLEQFRIRAGSTTVETLASLPAARGGSAYTSCGASQTMPDGTEFLERRLVGNTIIDSADFFRLDGAGWDSIGELGRPSAGPYTSDGMSPVFRDDHTAFALGNGADNSGLWEGDF